MGRKTNAFKCLAIAGPTAICYGILRHGLYNFIESIFHVAIVAAAYIAAAVYTKDRGYNKLVPLCCGAPLSMVAVVVTNFLPPSSTAQYGAIGLLCAPALLLFWWLDVSKPPERA